MSNKQKIRNVSLQSMTVLADEIHQHNVKLDKLKIRQKVADYLIENGDKAFCSMYNNAIAEGKRNEVLQKLKLV